MVKNSTLAKAFGKDQKGVISVVLYALGVLLGFINPWIGLSLYAIVAAMWFLPDRRIEKKLVEEEKKLRKDDIINVLQKYLYPNYYKSDFLLTRRKIIRVIRA